MSYDIRIDVAQLQADLRAMRNERDANWAALDRLRTRLRKIVPDVVEGGDLVGAIEAKLRAASEEDAGARAASVLTAEEMAQAWSIVNDSPGPTQKLRDLMSAAPAPEERCAGCGHYKEARVHSMSCFRPRAPEET